MLNGLRQMIFFFSFKGELAPLTSKARFLEGVNQCYELKLKGAY